MNQSRLTEALIAFALRQAETGTPAWEGCRKMGISEQTIHRWKKEFAGMGIAEIRGRKVPEEENRKLRHLHNDRRSALMELFPGDDPLSDVGGLTDDSARAFERPTKHFPSSIYLRVR
ncbi:MAG: transposase [Planctomycetota bacterium]|jgi:putative transposase